MRKIVLLTLLLLLFFVTYAYADEGFTLIDWSGLFSWLTDAVITALNWVLNGIILVIGYTFYYLFDAFILIASGLLSIIDLPGLYFSSMASLLGLPDSMLWFMNQLGIFTGIGIIIPAILIRKIIDIVPGGWQF